MCNYCVDVATNWIFLLYDVQITKIFPSKAVKHASPSSHLTPTRPLLRYRCHFQHYLSLHLWLGHWHNFLLLFNTVTTSPMCLMRSHEMFQGCGVPQGRESFPVGYRISSPAWWHINLFIYSNHADGCSGTPSQSDS